MMQYRDTTFLIDQTIIQAQVQTEIRKVDPDDYWLHEIIVKYGDKYLLREFFTHSKRGSEKTLDLILEGGFYFENEGKILK